eukprot:9482556-Pyramimonas_sp.AAC.1
MASHMAVAIALHMDGGYVFLLLVLKVPSSFLLAHKGQVDILPVVAETIVTSFQQTVESR